MPHKISSVTTYGTASKRWNGNPMPLAGSAYCAAAAIPNTAVPRSAPLIFQRPKMTIDSAMNPRPAVMFSANPLDSARARYEPAIPTRIDSIPSALHLQTRTHRATASGFSPEARSRSPNIVRQSSTASRIGKMIQASGRGAGSQPALGAA